MKVKIWGIFGVVVLVAALVVGLAGTVLAGGLQSWYLNNKVSPAELGGYQMTGLITAESSLMIPAGSGVIWSEAAQDNLCFCACDWKTDLFLKFETAPETVDRLTVFIGTSDGTAGNFTCKGSKTFTPDGTTGTQEQQPEISAGAFIVSTGDYLAFKLENNTTSNVNVDTGDVQQCRITGLPCDFFEIEIDIKPGSDPNGLNLKSKGLVAVAVLGSEVFNVNDIDPASVVFAGASPVRWSTKDVNRDGFMDMVFHFEKQELDLDENSTEATLTGIFDGTCFIGTDTVKIVHGKK